MKRTGLLGIIIVWVYSISAQVSITLVDTPIGQDFNSLASSGTNSTLPSGWIILETGGNSNTTYTAGNGSSATADTYSFGSGTNTDRALGELTGTPSTTFGASFTNNTGVSITSLLIQYVGEQWRLGATGRVDQLDFEYSTDATSLSTGTWTAVDNLDFVAPVTTGTIGALDGNVNANRKAKGFIIPSLSIVSGSTFWIRWVAFDAAGNDDGLSIDDFVLSANPITHYTVSTAFGVLTITDVAGKSDLLSITESGSMMSFFAKGRTYSFNSGAATPLPFDAVIASFSSISINAAAGNDSITIGTFTTSLPDLALNGGQGDDVVTFSGDLNFTSNEFLDADLQNDDATPGVDQIILNTNANINLSGTGAATLKASRNLTLNTGSSLTTVNGNLIVEANQQATPTSGTFIGLQLANGVLEVTGTGVMTIKGKGGNTAADQDGINISAGGDIIGGTSGTATIEGRGGISSSSLNDGIAITASGSTISSHGCNMSLTGYGGGTGASSLTNTGVLVTTAGVITAGGTGNVTINGTAGIVTANSNDGVRVTGANSKITSSGGNVSVTGFGGGTGSSATNVGVAVLAAGSITAGGTGTVIVSGTGGVTAGVNSFGVSVQSAGSSITSNNGNVTVTGQGGGVGASTLSQGISITSGGKISAGGSGNVVVSGTGGNGTGLNNNGIIMQNATSMITSSGGNVMVTGQGGGSGTAGTCSGINLIDGSITAGGSGTVSLQGTGGPGSGTLNYGVILSSTTTSVSSSSGDIFITGIEGGGATGIGMNVLSPGTITTLTNGGNISFKANSINLAGTVTTQAVDSVFIFPYSNSVQVQLGTIGESIGGPLKLSDTELDLVTTGTMIIGKNTTGAISVEADITRPALTNMNLISAGDIIINTGLLDLNGGNLFLDAGSSPAAVKPIKSGTDVNCNQLSFSSDLAFVFNGVVADVDYTQLTVNGTILLTGVNLIASGSHSPVGGETFTIINNDNADAIIGTFVGLPQGAIIPSFNGGNFPATLSYTGGDGNDVVITVLTPNYLITNMAGDLDITDLSGNSETLNMSQSGSNINFAVTGRNYSLNGNVVTNFPVNIPLAGIDSISIHAAAGNDVINVAAFTTSLPHLTINGGAGHDAVNMNGDITFLPNANLNLNLQNDHPSPGDDAISIASNVDLLLSGTGQAILQCSQSIFLNSGSVLQTQNGNLTLEANYQTVASTNSFSGVYILNGLVSVTGTGALTVKGKAGQSNNLQHGVRIESGGDIIGGTSGTVIVEGYGALATNQSCYGVVVMGSGSIISSNGAHVQVAGFGGGAGTSVGSSGVDVSNGGIITAGGGGHVTVNGTGGKGSGTNNNGVRVFAAPSVITSSGGNVTVTGIGLGTSNSSLGMGVSIIGGGKITAGGSGTVNVTGTGGANTGDSNFGIAVSGTGSVITSGGADVQVTGLGGGANTSFTNHGVSVSSGGTITAGGQGDVYINGTGGAANSDSNIGVQISLSGSSVTSTGGDIIITGQGGGIGASVLGMGVSVDAGGVVIAGGTGTVTIQGTGANTTGNNNHGIRVRNALSTISSSGGNVTITGTGGGIGASQIGMGVIVELGGKISAGGSGVVAVNGTGALNTASSAYGVYVSNTNSLITSSGGDVVINGVGRGAATSFGNIGVWVVNGAMVSAGNTGNVIVTGTGGSTSGNSNYGVVVQQANSLITSSGGNVNVTGQGGGTGNSQLNRGVLVSFGGRISAGSTGTVLVTGTGGTGINSGHNGVAIENTNSSITSGGGNIIITGIEGTGSMGINMNSLGSIFTNTFGGNISLIANSMSITGTITTPASNAISLKPLTSGKKIDLSTSPDVVGGPLRLTDAELDFMTTGSLIIGASVCDDIAVSTNITRAAATDMQLITGGDIVIDGGTVNTDLGTLYLQSGNSPKAIRPLQIGTDVNVDTLIMGNNLAILINGKSVDAQYTQLHVVGKINLNTTNLLLTGSYSPMGGDTFMIVNNNDNDMIIEKFAGLNEGDTLYNFLGSNLKATITYTGGDGNDAVIRVINPCVNPDIPIFSATPDTICQGTQVNLMITSGNLGGATHWQWYSHGCGNTSAGTGISIIVSPDSTTSYYVRGEGGCVTTSPCGSKTIVVNPFPDATIQVTASSDCYFTENIFQPQAPFFPGATYNWTFGNNAVPATATGYGPHSVIYNTAGSKSVQLVIHPNAPGPQCPDSSTITRDIIICTTQILGRVKSVTNVPIAGVNVRLFVDMNADGIADNAVAVRNVNTSAAGLFAMANVTPGNYILQQTQPATWMSFDDGDTSDDGDLAANIDSLDNIIPVTVVPSEVDSMNVFVESPIAGSITGNVFNDLDMDLVPDISEGLAGVSIQLFEDQNANGVADSGTPLSTVLTDASGIYTFSPVPVGHYVIVEVQPPDFISIKDYDATNDGDVVPNTNMLNDTIPLTITNTEADAQNFFVEGAACGLLVTNVNDDGLGSLRHAIDCAQDGDTIRFHSNLSGMSIFITSSILTIDKDIVFWSTLAPRIAIQSAINGLFEILPGHEVEFVSLKIISGLSPGFTGAAFENQGHLILNETDVYRNPAFPAGEYLIRNLPDSECEIRGHCEVKFE